MRGNSHVRFGGAGRGNGPPETTAPRPARPYTIAWLAGCPRLRIRYDRSSERFFAFVLLGCGRLCYNRWVRAGNAHRPP